MPADAKVEHIVLDHDKRQARVYYVSDYLPLVPEAGLIPEFTVNLTSHVPEPVA